MLLKWILVFKLQTLGLCRFSLEGVFSMQTVLFQLLCCSEVTISLLDHAAGNLELSPKRSASQNQHLTFLRGQNAAGELEHKSILVHCLLPWG